MKSMPSRSRTSADAPGGEAGAARADRDSPATADLVAAHSAVAWRLAQAVVPEPGASTAAVADGFTRVLRPGRRRSTDPVRFAVLAGTYRAALDLARAPGQAARDTEAVAARHLTGDAAVAAAAFRSLPERWRAALWLGEVEALPPIAVAASLDVSEAVAHQLLGRGRRALLSRLPDGAAPGALADALAPLAAPVPAGLASTVANRVRTGVAADLGSRLGERAARPLATAAAAVIAVGVISVGVLGNQAGPTGGPALRAEGAPAGSAAGVATGGGGYLNPISAVGGLSPYSALFPTLVGDGGSTLYGGAGALGSTTGSQYPAGGAAGAGTAAATGTAGTAPAAAASTPTPAAPPTGSSGAPAPGPAPAPTPAPAPGPAPVPAPAPLPAPPATVAAGPVTVTSGNGSVGVTTPVGGGSVGTCTTLNALGQPVTVACPTTSTTTAPAALPSPPTTLALPGGL